MSLCNHFKAGSWPFRIELVLDDHLGPTEALICCSVCERAYLLELLDWADNLRLFRVAEPGADATRLLLKDLERGSCDLGRAGEEVRQFALVSERLPELLLLDMNDRQIVRRVVVTDPDSIPRGNWRDLPCDGARIRAIQDAARL